MADSTTETVALLREIRDLLLPVADAYRDEYERRQAVRAALSTDKRREAWKLADGTRTQREIAKALKMDEGGTSKFFKSLRELGAIDGENPKRTTEV